MKKKGRRVAADVFERGGGRKENPALRANHPPEEKDPGVPSRPVRSVTKQQRRKGESGLCPTLPPPEKSAKKGIKEG